jgi:penicillin-binding protein 1A
MLRPSSLRLLVVALALLTTACADVVVLGSGDPVELAREPQTSHVLAADGSVLADLHAEQDRRDVALDQVPADLLAAIVAIEDRRFFVHRGVDLPAILRAATRNIEAGGVVEGGSTITQQYVKNTMLTPARTLDRKMREAVLAWQVEQSHGKDVILERYVNSVYFGHGAYGVAAAARRYFGIPVEELTLPQSAMLAGLIASPSRFDPHTDPDLARQRRGRVLDAMVSTGQVSRAEADAAGRTPFDLAPLPRDRRVTSPYAVEEVKRLIALDRDGWFLPLGDTRDERLAALHVGGYLIWTTIDPVMQAQAEAAVSTVLPEPDDPRAALVALDPHSGAIRALVGGRDFYDPDDPSARFNLATQSSRQAGSAFKPVALAAALSRGVGLDAVYPGGASAEIDDPACRGPDGPWTPTNYAGHTYGELTLREATVVSANTVFARLAAEIGPTAIVATARNLGVRGEVDPVCAVALGAVGVSPLDMATAYAPFATLGRRHVPHLITRIEASDGTLVYEEPGESTSVLEPAVAYLVTQTLEEVVLRGTGVGASIGRPQAGKTGTSDDNADAWFVGYTPDLVAAVWVGFPEGRVAMRPPRTRTLVEGGRWPAQIWGEFARAALDGTPASAFEAPEVEMVTVEVDLERNCLPNPYTPEDITGERSYVRGTEPTAMCTEPTGPAVDDVPGLVGLPRDVAVRLLTSRGFTVEERPIASRIYPPGYVAAQSPVAGGTVEVEDGAVIVWVSISTRVRLEIRDVVGLPVDDARETLEAEGWVVEVREACPCPEGAEPGTVLAQNPAAGTRDRQHALVTLRVVPAPPEDDGSSG